MPIYEYCCRNCTARFEKLTRGDAEVRCPECGSTVLDKLISAPAKRSSERAREPGHTCCGREERCDAPPCSTGGTCRHHGANERE